MSQKAKEFFEQLRGGEQRTGAMEAVKEGAQLVASRLSLSTILGEVGKELNEQWKHGSHELASALFTGNTYVQYARKDSREEPDHGLSQDAQQQEQSHGGHGL